MARYAVVDDATGLVTGVVEWDGASDWTPPEGHTAVLDTDPPTANPGFTYDPADGSFTPPPPPPPPPGQLTPLDQQILAAPDTLFGGPSIREVFDVHATGD